MFAPFFSFFLVEITDCSQSRPGQVRDRGRGLKFNTGRLRPEVRILGLAILYTIFRRKDTPFVYLPLTNGIPFVYPPNRKTSCHFHAAFNKLKQYSHMVDVVEIF